MATCEFKANLGYEVQSDIKQEMEEGREGVEEGGRGGEREENKDTKIQIKLGVWHHLPRKTESGSKGKKSGM